MTLPAAAAAAHEAPQRTAGRASPFPAHCSVSEAARREDGEEDGGCLSQMLPACSYLHIGGLNWGRPPQSGGPWVSP